MQFLPPDSRHHKWQSLSLDRIRQIVDSCRMDFHLDNATARHVVLHLQGLTRPPHLKFARGELLGLIEQLGFVQLDTIRWVERAHHMTLFARNQTYRPKHLARLHERECQVFENWTHDASLIPSKFYCYWRHKFRRDEKRLHKQFTKWQGAGFVDHVPELVQMISQNGRLKARDLEKPPKDRPFEMWEWHDGKAALEYLWRTGQLAVPAREGFQKCYDLSERVIPSDCFNNECDEDAFVDWACRSALKRLGFGTASDIARYWALLSIAEVRTWLDKQTQNDVARITVKPVGKGARKEFYARPDIAELVSELPKVPERMRALSPFDPVIRDRNRLQWLFGFDYKIEIYVPPEKRKYGYYVFPLLERDRLIGRVDMQAKRAENRLIVTKLWLEPKVRWSAAKEQRLASELQRQARLCGVSEIDWDQDRIAASLQ